MKISVLRVLAVLFFVWACPAKADLRFCNETGQKVDIAIAWHGDGDWHSSGWYKYAPGECASIVDGDLTSRYYWYYAEVAGGLKWSGDGDPNSGFFCTQQAKFRYRNANQTTCEGYTFKRIDTGESQNYTRRLTETRTEPLGAAIKCQDQIGRGRNEFIKCWMRNVGTSKQQEILKCFDATKTYAAFAICANKDQLSDSEYKIANCADEYMRTRVGGEFLTCVANGQLNTDQARIFECAVRNQGNYRAMGICAASGQLTDEQRRVFACVANNLNDYATAGLCAAGNQLTPEQTRIATCVLQNRGNYAQMGVCAVGDQLTPEQQVFVSCAISTGGQPYAFAVCVGTQLTVNELEKCMTEGFGGSGCFGDNNTAVKAIKNAWNDVTVGVGSGNEMVKAREAILGDDNGTLSNIIRDPVRCLTFQRDC